MPAVICLLSTIERMSVLKGIQMTFRALAVTGLCLALFQPAFAANDKTRVFIAKRWYTVSYVKDHVEKISPSLYKNAFNKSVSYAFAVDGRPANVGDYYYFSFPMATREVDFLRWGDANGGKNLDAEIDKLCVLETAGALATLKGKVRDRARSKDVRTVGLKHGVIAGIRSGQLAKAPLSLESNNKNSINVIPPEGAGRLLCNVYARKKGNDLVYEASVPLTAEGFYGRGR